MAPSRNIPFAALLLLLASVSGDAAEGDGSGAATACGGENGRGAYHIAGDDTWIPDCENPLKREYWRVFQQDGGTAYVIPRPDGTPLVRAACNDGRAPVSGLLEDYGFCSGATEEGQISDMNHMKVADALAITNYLHGMLRFSVDPDPMSLGITPFPIHADILAACDLDGGDNPPPLAEICEDERSDSPLPRTYRGPGAELLVARLNRLYGIN